MVPWSSGTLQLEARFHEMADKLPPSINELLTYGFFLGKEDLQLLGVILGVYFIHKRFWEELGMVLIGWARRLIDLVTDDLLLSTVPGLKPNRVSRSAFPPFQAGTACSRCWLSASWLTW